MLHYSPDATIPLTPLFPAFASEDDQVEAFNTSPPHGLTAINVDSITSFDGFAEKAVKDAIIAAIEEGDAKTALILVFHIYNIRRMFTRSAVAGNSFVSISRRLMGAALRHVSVANDALTMNSTHILLEDMRKQTSLRNAAVLAGLVEALALSPKLPREQMFNVWQAIEGIATSSTQARRLDGVGFTVDSPAFAIDAEFDNENTDKDGGGGDADVQEATGKPTSPTLSSSSSSASPTSPPPSLVTTTTVTDDKKAMAKAKREVTKTNKAKLLDIFSKLGSEPTAEPACSIAVSLGAARRKSVWTKIQSSGELSPDEFEIMESLKRSELKKKDNSWYPLIHCLALIGERNHHRLRDAPWAMSHSNALREEWYTRWIHSQALQDLLSNTATLEQSVYQQVALASAHVTVSK